MKKKEKQNKKKYDGYKHDIPLWKQKGFNSSKEYDEYLAEMYDDIRHGMI